MSSDLIAPVRVMNAASMATDIDGTPVDVMYTDNVTIQFVWTGTPTGTFGVSVSNDAILSPYGGVTGGTWTPLVLTSPEPPVASGAAGNGIINLTQLGARFVRPTYTRTSGTGSCTAMLSAKPV